MSFEFPNPAQFNEQIAEEETFTDAHQKLLFEAMKQEASSTNRVITIKSTSKFNIMHAEKFLAGKGYHVQMGTTMTSDQKDTWQVKALIITLRAMGK